MSMNDFLEQVYAQNDAETNEAIAVEKLAQAQVVEDLLKKESGDQIDLDHITIPELYKVACTLFGEDSILAIETAAAYEKLAAAENGEEDEDEEDEDDDRTSAEKKAELQEIEKIATNADASGRIMAHAFIDELNQMNKEASMASTASKAYGAARSGVGKAYSAARGVGGSLRDVATAKRLRKGLKQRKDVKGLSDKARSAVLPEANKNILRGGAATGALYGGAGAAGLYGASKMRGKKKEASLLDIVAEVREHTEKQAEINELVNARAYQILEEAGLE